MGERVCMEDTLGVPPGGELSPEDMRLLYQKVFHHPATEEDVLVAMKKVAGRDEMVSCVGENIRNVFLEMQKERERQEELHWSKQLLAVGKRRDGSPNDTEARVFQQLPRSDPSPSKHAQNISPPGSPHSDLPQMEPDRTGVLHLKRSARRCWSRLVTEGVHSVAPRQHRPTALEVRGHALGCFTTDDLLSVLEVKYDAVSRLLYTEMLRQHFGSSTWENLPPWQRNKELEGVEDRAERALGSGDLLGLSWLPGVLRTYRTRASRSAVQSCWSAVNVLTEAHASLQREKDSLTRASSRLDRDSMKLVFLHIRLSTFRAQSERWSYGALLAASQLWESWPRVRAPRREEMVEQWLHGEEEEEEEEEKHREMCLSASPQQAVLQWLVLTQKAEREALVGLLRGVSLDLLEGPENPDPGTDEDPQRPGSLWVLCVRRLQQIRSLQTPASVQEGSRPAGPAPRPADPPGRGPGAAGGRGGWGECAATLLGQLADAQENQVHLLLPSLLHMSIEHLQVLREKYRSDLQTQHFSGLLNLLIPEVTESSLVEVRSEPAPIIRSGPITDGNCKADLYHKAAAELLEPEEHEEPEEPGSSGGTDLCTGCGASLEGLPYLEIISGPEEGSLTEGEGARREGEEPGREAGSPPEGEEPWSEGEEPGRVAGSPPEGEEPGRGAGSPPEGEEPWREGELPGGEAGPRGTQAACEASLIALAWSKRTACGPEVAGTPEDGGLPPTGPGSYMEELEELQPLIATPSVLMKPASAVQTQQETPHTCSGVGLLEDASAAEDAAAAAAPPAPPAEIQQLQQEAQTAADRRRREAGREWAGAEVCPPPPAPPSHQPTPHSPQEADPEEGKATEAGQRKGCEAAEVWRVEREKTMSTLVEMQRKVEGKQQRDRDRQLLRVQERLAIIQNKKAEEDLLGLKQRETLEQLTHNLPQDDKSQQKSLVRARLEQLRRERSCVLQSKRERNTAGLKELLGPVVCSTDTENSTELVQETSTP